MILIGSRALGFNFDLGERLDKADYDVIMSIDDFNKWVKDNNQFIHSLIPRGENKYKAIVWKDDKKTQYEIELGFNGTSSSFLLENIFAVTDSLGMGAFNELYRVLTPEYQLLTKKSHIVYPVHWEKNIKDYHLLRSILEDRVWYVNKTMHEYYKLRSNEAKERFKKFKTPKLNISTEDFFSSKLNVPHYFVHDDIHKIMAHDVEPMYSKMQPDPKMAWCSKDMFFNLTYQQRVQCVQEEAYVIALERYIIPQVEGSEDHFECYHRALKRICTTLCSGWFREFAYESYPKLVEWYDPNFVQKFCDNVKLGNIKVIEGKTVEDIPVLFELGV